MPGRSERALLTWHDRLPDRVFRLLSWLQLTELPERDAARVVSWLSRAELSRDDFGARTHVHFSARSGPIHGHPQGQ
jgi:hypothetical protein